MSRFLKSVFIFCLFVPLSSFAQVPENLFLQVHAPQEIQKSTALHLKKVLWLQPDSLKLLKILMQQPEHLSLRIPSEDGSFIVDLHRSELESPRFSVRTTGGEKYVLPLEKPLYYQGFIRGKTSSLVAFSLGKNSVTAVISAGEGNLNLVKYRSAAFPLYALFNERDIRDEHTFSCHSEGLSTAQRAGSTPAEEKPLPASPLSGNCRRVDVYFECDYRLYQDQGGTVQSAVDYVQSLFNVVAAIYAQTGVNVRISEIFVHTQPDNYPSTTSFEALDAFMDSVNTRPAFDGTLGHLLSTLPKANGGVAYLDVLCSAGTGFNIGYSNIFTSFLPLPYYSWSVNVLAHELGHNFGSPHTQSCSWEVSPGVQGMLDSCYFAEGECYTGPRIASVGTMMSYCHLMNLGVDFSRGFGNQPGALIRDRYLNSSCLPGAVDFPQLSITRPDSVCSGSTANLAVTPVPGAGYQWSGPGGFSAATAAISIPNIGPAQEGSYSCTISKDGCDAVPLVTALTVNCIFPIPLSSRRLCRGSSFELDYQTSFTPQPGNQFIAEISDATGSFSNPVLIGSLSGSAPAGSIPVQIPLSLIPDSSYRLRVRSTFPAKTGEVSRQLLRILPLPAAPMGVNRGRCGPGTVQLEVSAAPGDSVFWYNSPAASVPLASGPVFMSPFLNAPSGYWAETRRMMKSGLGPTPNPAAGDTLKVANTYHGIFIQVKKNLILDSVWVFASGPGLVHINIKDSLNTFLYKKIIRPVSGLEAGEKIALGLEISPGIYRIDSEKSTVPGLLRLNNFFSYPLNSEGMAILGSSVPGRHYFFFDWVYRMLDCPSERKEIRAEIYSIPEVPVITQSGQFVIASADTLFQWYKDGAFLGVFGDTLDASDFGSGQYQAVWLTQDSCSSVSALLNVLVTEKKAFSAIKGIKMFPNPVHDFLQIKAENIGWHQLLLLDATGRKIWDGGFESELQLDVRSLPPGAYLIRLENKEGVLRQLWVKE